MPITATYQVQCDVCWSVLDGEYDTREDAQEARRKAGWQDTDDRTACPTHNTTAKKTTS
ncbi:hypothetical protein LRE75_03160 [Streptomyces sp. 372A]